MSDNKRDKDSYAKDTLEFSVPSEYIQNKSSQRRPPQQSMQRPGNNGQRPERQNPQRRQPNGQASQGQGVHGRTGQRQQIPGRNPNQMRGQGNNTASRAVNPQNRNNNMQSGVRPVQNRPPQNNRPVNNASAPKPKKKKIRKKGGCLTKIIISLLSVFIVLFGIYSIIVMGFISKINIVETGERVSSSHSLLSSSSVKNILLIGTDSRGEDRGRSDSMILLSINSKTDKITMCSLMRDMYVQIPGYGSNKLNAAYSYGGPELLMDTIEENLYIEIDDYVTVNFVSFANIVDAVGGVEIEVSDNEADAMNVLLQSPEGVSFFGEPSESDLLDGGGTYNLSGKQALCYSRLRYVGNADFERTQRQRKVLEAIIKKAANPVRIGAVAKEALPSMNTNMSKLNMYLLSLRGPGFLLGYDVEQMRIPADDTYWGSDIDGMYVLEVDFEENIDLIEDKLYGNK